MCLHHNCSQYLVHLESHEYQHTLQFTLFSHTLKCIILFCPWKKNHHLRTLYTRLLTNQNYHVRVAGALVVCSAELLTVARSLSLYLLCYYHEGCSTFNLPLELTCKVVFSYTMGTFFIWFVSNYQSSSYTFFFKYLFLGKVLFLCVRVSQVSIFKKWYYTTQTFLLLNWYY